MLKRFLWPVFAVLAAAFALSISAATAGTPVSGAVFTTDSTCSGVDLNIYGALNAVYLDGGPTHTGAAGLPDGSYYVQVTEPNGTQLGYSTTANVTVSGGEFTTCYSLWDNLVKTSDGTTGYDATSNPGGEYKVWVSTVSTFDNDVTKTDNFKVKLGPTPPTTGTITVEKFYDANANGIKDAGESFITGWKVNISDGFSNDRFTPVNMIVDAPADYTVTEYNPVETNWLHTTATSDSFSLAAGATHDTQFGNVCLGAGGGLTLGFWSNKNGQALVTASDLAFLTGLNLRNATGANFDPATAKALASWLLSATATNMAYMLSAQLTAMELNVRHGFVSGTALVWNGSSFVTINSVMAAANTSLGTDGYTVAAGATRSYQEGLKNTLDAANNNLNFVQATACAFSFAP